jgi:flavin reductase (DIM6/NTAB) family NADH-FMN oxidoreductase RutF
LTWNSKNQWKLTILIEQMKHLLYTGATIHSFVPFSLSPPVLQAISHCSSHNPHLAATGGVVTNLPDGQHPKYCKALGARDSSKLA